MAKDYETVIGLEVHVELATKTKIFCGCSTAFGGKPNSHTCPVCTGMPGSLPVLNRKVLEHAVAVGLATNCRITRYCKFDRKNYFYPDNPQNYQISQLYLPICRDGYVEIDLEEGLEGEKASTPGKKRIGIHEIHMEEDAGKLIHDEWEDCTLVDYNRSGVPLIEIVSEPDMRSAEEVISYLEKLRLIIQYLGASDCKLQEGSMRADVNLSVRELGSAHYGTRTEMKNLNSFHAISRAIEGERERQIDLLESGKAVVQETRRWDDLKGTSYAMRSKEDAQDYRYFPEPDIPPIELSQDYLDGLRGAQPELAEAKRERYRAHYGLPEYDCRMITSDKALAAFFEGLVALGAPPKQSANWIMGEVLGALSARGMEPKDMRLTPPTLARLIERVGAGTVNRNTAVKVFEAVFDADGDVDAYVREHGLEQVNDNSLVRDAAARALEANPQSAADYKGGKEKALGFLVGQVMRELKGRADPQAVNAALRELLG